MASSIFSLVVECLRQGPGIPCSNGQDFYSTACSQKSRLQRGIFPKPKLMIGTLSNIFSAVAMVSTFSQRVVNYGPEFSGILVAELLLAYLLANTNRRERNRRVSIVCSMSTLIPECLHRKFVARTLMDRDGSRAKRTDNGRT
jgi:hypothetical protein